MYVRNRLRHEKNHTSSYSSFIPQTSQLQSTQTFAREKAISYTFSDVLLLCIAGNNSNILKMKSKLAQLLAWKHLSQSTRVCSSLYMPLEQFFIFYVLAFLVFSSCNQQGKLRQ